MLSQPGNGGRNVRKTKRDYYHIIVDVRGEKKKQIKEQHKVNRV